jgi:hypothetical protein
MTIRVILASAMLLLLACNPTRKKAETKPEIEELKRQIAELKSTTATPSPPSQPSTAKSRVSGSVFYRKKSGDSIILRALPIYLLTPEEAGSKFTPEMASKPTETLEWIMGMNGASFDLMWPTHMLVRDGAERFFRDFDQVAEKMKNYASRARLKTTTNIDGKYLITGVSPASYHLLAVFEAADVRGYWYLKLDVVGDHTLDLDNATITKVFDVSTESQ